MTQVSRPLAPLITSIALCLVLTACSQTGARIGKMIGRDTDQTEAPVDVTDAGEPVGASLPAPATVETSVEVGAQGNSAEALDTTTEAEKAAATAVSAPTSGLLGETVASLGDPTKAGFWLMTPLVKTEKKGRIERSGGAVAIVTLIPSGGEASGGSQISLAAMRALDLDLTDLVALKVYAD